MLRRPAIAFLAVLFIAPTGCGMVEGDETDREAQGLTSIKVMFNKPEADCQRNPVSGNLECTQAGDPTGYIRPGLVNILKRAKASIDLAIYGLDDPPVLDALCSAAKRGVKVRVLGDGASEIRCSNREARAIPDAVRTEIPIELPVGLIGFKAEVDQSTADGGRKAKLRLSLKEEPSVVSKDSVKPSLEYQAVERIACKPGPCPTGKDCPYKVGFFASGQAPDLTGADENGKPAGKCVSSDKTCRCNEGYHFELPPARTVHLVVEKLDDSSLEDGQLKLIRSPSCDSKGDWYWPSFKQLADCGAEVHFFRTNGIMHNKFYLVDRGERDFTDPERRKINEYILTGSMNMTSFCIENNHNHMLFLQNPPPELFAAYLAEFEELIRCSTAGGGICLQDASEHGPWTIQSTDLELYFSPTTRARPVDALEILRGKASDKDNLTWEGDDPKKRVPEHCKRASGNCTCQQKTAAREGSPAVFKCHFCAGSSFESNTPDAAGWGLIGEARERVLISIYAGTDPCFFLGMARAAQRHRGSDASKSIETLAIINSTEAGQPSTRDDFLAAHGVPTYIANWGPIDTTLCRRPTLTDKERRESCMGSSIIRNHNKMIVIDDKVFDGSMNISSNGNNVNNENTLVLTGKTLSDRFADYIRDEVVLLGSRGVKAMEKPASMCQDLVDNDLDGLADRDEAACTPCTNGEDDDNDGLTDKDDPDCDLPPVATEPTDG